MSVETTTPFVPIASPIEEPKKDISKQDYCIVIITKRIWKAIGDFFRFLTQWTCKDLVEWFTNFGNATKNYPNYKFK